MKKLTCQVIPKNFISFAKSSNENYVGISNEKMKIYEKTFTY